VSTSRQIAAALRRETGVETTRSGIGQDRQEAGDREDRHEDGQHPDRQRERLPLDDHGGDPTEERESHQPEPAERERPPRRHPIEPGERSGDPPIAARSGRSDQEREAEDHRRADPPVERVLVGPGRPDEEPERLHRADDEHAEGERRERRPPSTAREDRDRDQRPDQEPEEVGVETDPGPARRDGRADLDRLADDRLSERVDEERERRGDHEADDRGERAGDDREADDSEDGTRKAKPRSEREDGREERDREQGGRKQDERAYRRSLDEPVPAPVGQGVRTYGRRVGFLDRRTRFLAGPSPAVRVVPPGELGDRPEDERRGHVREEVVRTAVCDARGE